MKLTPRQKRNALLTLALGVTFCFYAGLRVGKLHDTAALYMGLPLAIAVVTSLIETRRIVSTTMKVLTIALLLSPILIGEGFICLIMASPIMYAVAFIVSSVIELIYKAVQDDKKPPLHASSVLVLIALLSLEGTTPLLSMERQNEVTVEKTLSLSAEELQQALGAPPKFDKQPASFYTRLFPGPARVEGSGMNIGDQRRIHLVYNKWVVTNPLSGDAVFEISDRGEDHVTFKLVEDTSYINLYLLWQDATVHFTPQADGTTKVRLTIRYLRKLDPAWYFSGMERAAVTDAAHTLLDSLRKA